MKLVVEKVGRIERAEIEVRPLTVFIGENGTGKTWVAHGLFKILERFRTHSRPSTRPGEMSEGIEKVLDAKSKWIVDHAREAEGEARFLITRDELLAQLPSQVRAWLAYPQWESAIGFGLDKARLTLEVPLERFAKGVASRVELTVSLDPPPFRVTKKLFVDGMEAPQVSTEFGDPERGVRTALEELLCGWKRRVRALPVERELLAQIFPELIKYQLRMPRALVDFIYLMNEPRGREAAPTEHALSSTIRDIMGGQFRFVGVNRELKFELMSGDELPIPVAAAASLGKSLAGLDIFLWTASEGDIVIIDEPEMNAHPWAQVALVELFALMIRRGIQLVIITHSPYIVDHLSTLIELARLDEAKRARVVDALALKNAEAYLKPDEVAVWQFNKDGSVTSVYNEESGSINWSTFTRVTNQESVTINRILDEADDGAGESA